MSHDAMQRDLCYTGDSACSIAMEWIQRRAYFLWMERGRPWGKDLEIWLEAENQELKTRCQSMISQEWIQRRAYFLWMDRGRPWGEDLEIWLEAENQELKTRCQSLISQEFPRPVKSWREIDLEESEFRDLCSFEDDGAPESTPAGSRNESSSTSLSSDCGVAEPVFLGASSPMIVAPGEEFTARFAAYVEKLHALVRDRLLTLSRRSIPHLGLRSCRWTHGTHVTVALSGNHLHVSPAVDNFVWDGGHTILDFDVEVDKAAGSTVTVLKFDVIIAGFTIARLRLDLEIHPNPNTVARRVAHSTPATTAFASYASQDRLRVLDRIAEVRRNGVDVFLDCLSLNPGDVWKTRIATEIEVRELFFLFWSQYAARSEWVAWEWTTALRLKGLLGIEPHPLDPESIAPPPDELKSLHFSDVYMTIRAAYGQTH